MAMNIWEILLTGIGLSMDAFAVSVCKGLSLKHMEWKKALLAGLYFGSFQALMPLAGYLAGSRFYHVIEKVDHWIVFVILILIGLNMIREARSEMEKGSDSAGEAKGADFSPAVMLPLAVATSIDALAVGISFAFLRVAIIRAVVLIGCTTCLLSVAGVRLGRSVGSRFHEKAEIAGGVILILIGTHVLLQHLGVMPF